MHCHAAHRETAPKCARNSWNHPKLCTRGKNPWQNITRNNFNHVCSKDSCELAAFALLARLLNYFGPSRLGLGALRVKGTAMVEMTFICHFTLPNASVHGHLPTKIQVATDGLTSLDHSIHARRLLQSFVVGGKVSSAFSNSKLLDAPHFGMASNGCSVDVCRMGQVYLWRLPTPRSE